jgi:hypothetical protein
MPIFSYEIVPADGHAGQAVARGSLYIADVESAKRHVQTVLAPDVPVQPGLEVILHDSMGSEIWRGPYVGSINP